MARQKQLLTRRAYRDLRDRVEEKRKRHQLRKGDLKEKIGVSSSSEISHLYAWGDRGETEVTAKQPSEPSIRKMATWVGLAFEYFTALHDDVSVRDSVLAYCSNDQCVTHRFKVFDDHVYARPQFRRVKTGTTEYCKACGELLQETCANCPTEHRAPVQEELRCGKCGQRYVALPHDFFGLNRSELADACRRRNFEAQLIYPVNPYNTWI